MHVWLRGTRSECDAIISVITDVSERTSKRVFIFVYSVFFSHLRIIFLILRE